MRKYETEYKQTKNRKDFIVLAMRRYKGIKRNTAIRRYYDLRKLLGTQTPKYHSTEKEKPNHIKMLQLQDMKRLNYKITRELLHTYGYSELEINWLIDEEDINV